MTIPLGLISRTYANGHATIYLVEFFENFDALKKIEAVVMKCTRERA